MIFSSVVQSILIGCRSVWLWWQAACISLDALWFERHLCRKVKGYSLSVFQHTPSCQIKSKSNNVQRKGTPQSHQSIIWCNNESQVYVGWTFIIHAFIRKACREEMNIYLSISLGLFLSKGERYRPHLSRLHCTQTRTQMHNTGVDPLPSISDKNDWKLTVQTRWNTIMPIIKAWSSSWW